MPTERVLNMDEMLKRFEFLGANLPASVFNAMLGSAKVMLASVVRKVRGQYLKVDTGRGWQSFEDFARLKGANIQAGIDTDVTYMRAHEEGFHGRVQVRAHTRQAYRVAGPSGRATKKSAREFKLARARSLRRVIYVRAHSMRMNIRARRFMGDTVDQQFAPTQDRVVKALVLAARTGEVPTVAQIGA
jgi:hypothetical protein